MTGLMIPAASTVEFAERHGGKDAGVRDGRFVIFPDGACYEVSAYGERLEPDADPHKRAKDVARYWEVCHGHALEDFETMRHMLMSNAKAAHANGWDPGNEESPLAELTKLRDHVRAMQARLNAAKAEVERTVPAAIAARQKAQSQNRAACEAFLGKLHAIKL
jgi:hypothetical protein